MAAQTKFSCSKTTPRTKKITKIRNKIHVDPAVYPARQRALKLSNRHGQNTYEGGALDDMKQTRRNFEGIFEETCGLYAVFL